MSRAKFEDNEIGAVCGNSEEKEKIKRLRDELNNADDVVIGAGLGLSASAGLAYSGKRFEKYFEDFCDKYGFCDMIDGRNKGDAASQPKTDYFVVTTNIDHQFKKAGFSKRRIFYSQGDYSLWQCSKPCHQRTHDNKAKIIKMVLAQGFVLGDEGILDSYKGQHVLFLELGVGAKTPVKIKYPFWEMTEENENAVYDSNGVVVNGCRFDGPADGESALKESRNVIMEDWDIISPEFGWTVDERLGGT